MLFVSLKKSRFHHLPVTNSHKIPSVSADLIKFDRDSFRNSPSMFCIIQIKFSPLKVRFFFELDHLRCFRTNFFATFLEFLTTETSPCLSDVL